MALLFNSQNIRVYDLEVYIDNLLRQKELLQSIEEYTANKLDFGDLLETYHLVIEEIERLQEVLRSGKV